MKLTAYRLASTSGAAWREKNAAARNTSTCSRAEHRENGIASIDSSRDPRERSTRVPMIAGTLQPRPISCMTKARPSRPSRDIQRSIRKAMRTR